MSSPEAAAAASASAASCERDPSGAKKCVPCESLDASALLSRSEVEAELSSALHLWTAISRDDDRGSSDHGRETVDALSRKYTAKNFQCALDSINAMGTIAEREGHHPDFHLTSYRNVEVVLYTHSLGGVSANDVALAKMLDGEVTVEYSPKWLKNNPRAKQEG